MFRFFTATMHVHAWPVDLHDDVTYEGWGKTSAAGHNRQRMYGEFQTRVEIHQFATRKTDRHHVLIVATQRVGVFISVSDGCITIGEWR